MVQPNPKFPRAQPAMTRTARRWLALGVFAALGACDDPEARGGSSIGGGMFSAGGGEDDGGSTGGSGRATASGASR
ncbi:MAG: hypothetical protein JKY37_16260 [Nannocystaceae bacterium]|nr:hypothetical protein [Nannocystaceae bacterium]